jgi:hypothetical protein
MVKAELQPGLMGGLRQTFTYRGEKASIFDT